MKKIGDWVRAMIPPPCRAWLRRSAMVNRLLKSWYGGVVCKRHPAAPYDFYLDGYRNIGWAAGSLSQMEVPELQFAQEMLKKCVNRCAWDIGANIGFWSLFLAGVQPPLEQIISFEPDAINRKWLAMNIERNGITCIAVRDVALSDHVGEAVFFSDEMTGSTGSLEQEADFIGKYYGAARKDVKVALSTVDEEIEHGCRPPGFIKIDVEGHELSVLKGAAQTLRRHRPSLMIEITQNLGEVGQLLGQMDYELYDPRSGRRLSEPQFETAAIPRENV